MTKGKELYSNYVIFKAETSEEREKISSRKCKILTKI